MLPVEVQEAIHPAGVAADNPDNLGVNAAGP